jgi:hypothetical protein
MVEVLFMIQSLAGVLSSRVHAVSMALPLARGSAITDVAMLPIRGACVRALIGRGQTRQAHSLVSFFSGTASANS